MGRRKPRSRMLSISLMLTTRKRSRCDSSATAIMVLLSQWQHILCNCDCYVVKTFTTTYTTGSEARSVVPGLLRVRVVLSDYGTTYRICRSTGAGLSFSALHLLLCALQFLVHCAC